MGQQPYPGQAPRQVRIHTLLVQLCSPRLMHPPHPARALNTSVGTTEPQPPLGKPEPAYTLSYFKTTSLPCVMLATFYLYLPPGSDTCPTPAPSSARSSPPPRTHAPPRYTQPPRQTCSRGPTTPGGCSPAGYSPRSVVPWPCPALSVLLLICMDVHCELGSTRSCIGFVHKACLSGPSCNNRHLTRQWRVGALHRVAAPAYPACNPHV